MLIGTYEHSIDAKKRIIVPVKFRDELGNTFVIKVYPSKFPCVQLYSTESFNERLKEALQGVTNPIKQRKIKAQFFIGTGEVTLDPQGRIIVPSKIAELAKLEKEIISVGMDDCVEIWNPEFYEKYYESVSESLSADETASDAEDDVYRSMEAEGKFLSIGGDE